MLIRLPCRGCNCIYHTDMARGTVTQAGGLGQDMTLYRTWSPTGPGPMAMAWRSFSHTDMWWCLQGAGGGMGGGGGCEAAKNWRRRPGGWLHGQQ